MKTLHKMAMILLVFVAVGCAPIYGNGYGAYGGGQGYGYHQPMYNYSREPYARHEWTQIGPYSGRGGFERRHDCTQYGVGCIR